MNQCMANRSCHASMLGRQLIERRNGVRIAQDYGNLPPLLAQRGLTLSAGLWADHSEKPEFTASHVGHDDHALSPNGKDCVLQDAGIAGVHGGCNRGGGVVVHGLIRSGPIPPMGESYAVTSDVSTPYAKDFLEVA